MITSRRPVQALLVSMCALPLGVLAIGCGSTDVAAPNDMGADTAVLDSGIDTASGDSSNPDSATIDSATADTSPADTLTVDTSTVDTSTVDTSTVDTSFVDVGSDTSVDSGLLCPATTPAFASSCPKLGLECQYGDDPRQSCRPLATCGASGWEIVSPRCAAIPPAKCPATREVAQGTACPAEGAYCSYPTDLLCHCTNCKTGPIAGCSGAPVWQCTAPNPVALCPNAPANAGTACSNEALVCQYGCGTRNGRTCAGKIWTITDGGPCPVSTRTAKKDIVYLSDADVTKIASEVRTMKLASWEYKDVVLAGRRHVGIIIEDQPSGSPAVDPSRNMVDLYGYTSMLVANAQAQAKRLDDQQKDIDALKKELAEIRAALKVKMAK